MKTRSLLPTELAVYVLDAPLEVRRARVQQRNIDKGTTFFKVVPDHVFELASQMGEASDELECAEYDIIFMSSAPETNADALAPAPR